MIRSKNIIKNQLNISRRRRNWFYFRTGSSLFVATAEVVRADVVTVRDKVVRETGDAGVLFDDGCCSVVDESGRL